MSVIACSQQLQPLTTVLFGSVRIYAMGTIIASPPQLSVWSVMAFWAFIVYMFVVAGRAEERRRREEGQPHTRRDTALLFLTACSVVGALLCAAFFKPLNTLVNSRAG